MTTHTTPLPTPFGNADALLPPAAAATSRPLRLPSVEQPWRYRMRYWATLLRNLASTNRLHATRTPTYTAAVHVSEVLCARWHRLFGTDPAAGLPYQTNQSVGTLAYSRIFADLGVHYAHLLHVRHDTTHDAGAAALAAARQMVLHCGVRRLLRMGEDRALVELQTQVHDADGQRLATVHDTFLVRGLPAADLAQVPGDRAAMRELLGLRRRLPQLSLSGSGVQTCWLPLVADLGRDFGRVSGDMNPVHTTRLGARLFGVRRPFLQGLGLRSLLLAPLAAMGLPLQQLSITYAAPAALGQSLALVVQGSQFEVHDERGGLVAFGSCGG